MLVVVDSSASGKLLATAAEIVAGLRSMVVVAWLVTTGKSVERDMVAVSPSGTVKVGREG